ncbi:MAG: hypothetical protein WDW36_004771 [Sanguina aurantia]
MATHIFNIFQQRRPTSEQYASRLPDFVRRLEDVLYKQAKSLAEYVDLGTLDHRLQAVALHFVGRPSAQVNASGSSPHATGSQGAPGHEMLHSSQQQQPQQALMGPNPVPSMSGGVPQMQQQQAQQQQQQQQVNTSYTPSNPSLNGNYTPQPAPAFSPGGGALRSNYMPMSMPGTAPAPADSSNPGSGFNPRQSPASMPANSVYGGNVPGLPVMSNGAPVLRNSANRDWMGQNLQQHGMNAGAPSGPLKGQMNGMVPSPQLSSGGMMPMPMPQGGNGPSSSMGNGFGALPAIPFLGSQGHQAPNHNPAGYDMGSLPATGASKMMPITSYHSPSSSSHHLVPVPSAAGGPGLGSSFGPQSSGGNGGALGPGPASGFVPQNGGISSSGPGAGGFGAGGNGGGSSAFGPSATLQTCSMNGGGGGGGPGLGPGFIPQIPGSGSMGGMRESPAFSPQISSQAPGVADGAGFGAQAMGGNAAGLGPGTGFGQQGVAGNGEGRAVSGGGGGVGTPAAPSLLPGVPDDATDETRHTHVQKQQRWLLYLRHCAKCHVPGNECSLKQQCKFGKQLWQHILSCQETECPFPRCTTSKELLKHHQRCQNISCPICAPVKEYVRKTRIATAQHSERQQQQLQQQQQQLLHQNATTGGQPQTHQQHPHNNQHPHNQQQNSHHNPHNSNQQQPDMSRQNQDPGQQPQQRQQRYRHAPDPWPGNSSQPSVTGQKRGHGHLDDEGGSGGGGGAEKKPAMMVDSKGFALGTTNGMLNQGPLHDGSDLAVMVKDDPVETERKRVAQDEMLGKNTGTSLLEAYEPRMIIDHVNSLQSAAAAQRETQADAPASDICKVCLLTKLSFEPPVIYCTQCANKIKRGQTYYSTPPDASNDIKGSWCHNCYQEPKGDKLNFDGAPLKKTDLMKRKNDEEIEEAWVQCDHCEFWVHQTCGMFNKGRNNPDVRYLCPDCLLQGMRLGRRQRIETRPQSMLEAKDLPRCQLSDQLQERLDQQLHADWVRRAQEQGSSSVARADPVTVRVINSVMKKCEVRHAFAESFRNEGYPTEFPYRQRVILLFQNLDGVDVCLFCLYVQEYGKDCPAPNTNCVYLSYLDSIKYFRPEVPAGGGVPSVGLRTFAYHQLLIGYLAYIKKLGFEQMYIWACPPMAGDDYILYCHPSKQKTPRSDRLRQWYIEMLKTAQQEGIVKHITTLWDTYFEGGKDHRLERCSATHIPYLEGDYWPGEAENLLTESLKAASKSNKKGSGVSSGAGGGGSGAGRAAAKGKRYGSGPTTADELLMGRLGEILGGNMKEDFIVVHLTEVCTFCRAHLKGGSTIHRYRSSTPLKPAPVLKFEGIKIEQGPSIPINAYHQLSICEHCYQDEKHRAHTQQVLRLPTNLTTDSLSTSRVEDLQPHQLLPDTDIDMDNEFFETRQTFLSLCQGNHYQFDTLRRAKHSSMMVLYHLHNPSAPAFTTSCNVCQSEIEPGAGFRCTVCTDFDICGKCKSTIQHPHAFMAHVIKPHETQMRLTDSERRERHEQLQRTMALLIHACSCHSALCASNSCRKVKALMAHAMECVPSVSGGCQMCRKMWVLLNLHSKCCNKAVCSVPRCSELKEMRRRQTSRQEELRRSAYTTMAQQQ